MRTYPTRQSVDISVDIVDGAKYRKLIFTSDFICNCQPAGQA
jgi:hypothetical protein